MLAPPSGIGHDTLADVLQTGWSIAPSALSYAPLGFGSHHWIADDHFVTVDEATDELVLRAALTTARSLRDDAGLEFVIAPIPAHDGRLIVPLARSWVVHVYERLEITDETGFGPHDDPEVVALVQAIHEATPIVGHHARREDFFIWARDDLANALSNLDGPWDTGPYGEPARRLLAENADDVRHLLAAHDGLVNDVPGDGWVVTHGEPHRGNIFRTTSGWAVVDWDTVLIAPAERDFWDIGGAPCDPQLAQLYRMRWDLADIAVYVAGFCADHTGDANDDRSWENLVSYLDVRNRWPDQCGRPAPS